MIKDFAAGRTQVASVDNARTRASWRHSWEVLHLHPRRPDGTTESFLAGESTQGQNFPINPYKLTPNMVAGLITSLYQ